MLLMILIFPTNMCENNIKQSKIAQFAVRLATFYYTKLLLPGRPSHFFFGLVATELQLFDQLWY